MTWWSHPSLSSHGVHTEATRPTDCFWLLAGQEHWGGSIPGRQGALLLGDLGSRTLCWPYQIFIELHCSFRLPHLTFLPPFCPLPGSDLHCSLKAPNIYSSPFPCALPGFPLNKSLTHLIPTWLLRGLRLIQSVHWSSCFHNYTPTLYTAARRNQVKIKLFTSGSGLYKIWPLLYP